MTKIVSVKTKILETRMAEEDFVTSYGPEQRIKYHVMVHLSSNEGISGIGEACPLPDFTGETHDVIQMMIDKYYKPILIEKDPYDLELIHRELDQKYPANNAAKAAIDMAIYDLLGKTLGIPVYRLLGGRCRQYVEVGAVLGIGEPSDIAQRAARYVDQGAKAIKLKVGIDVYRDIETVKAVRDALGDKIHIRIDANAGYSIKEAMKVLKRTEKWDLEYVEQPTAPWDLEGLSLLRKATSTPIMVDESICTIADAVELIRSEAADFFGLKLIKHGGIYKAKKIAILAEANGIECVVISPWETQIGQAAGVHLALSSNNFNHPNDLGTEGLEDDPTHGLQEEHGIIQSPPGPGLGVTYNFESD
ncbi:MAG: mandelate racemase/muconate lactonizing enzyme family protein [Candidatus Heimdallarchaeota archaeon]